MRAGLILIASSFLMLPLVSQADPCGDVVADTIAEIRAGADGGWSDDMESLVRAAAGSACIKARSDRYVASPAPAVMGKNVAQAPAEVASDPAAAKNPAEKDASETDDDGSWSVGGLTFRSMSGSPTQKPYERARQTKKEDP